MSPNIKAKTEKYKKHEFTLVTITERYVVGDIVHIGVFYKLSDRVL